MCLADDPDERLFFPPPACRGCGGCLDAGPVTATRRHQVTDITPPPPPQVIQYVAQAKRCPCCGTVTAGELPPHVRARASYRPQTCAQAANLACGHHIPVWRSTLLLCHLGTVAVSTGWMAGIGGRAAALIEASGFIERVRELVKAAPAHADETPARAAGGTRYVHLACTAYLTLTHTGDRSSDAIDAGGVLPGYRGVIVRDGYSGYGHLTDALHAWRGAHYLLRDLKGLYHFEPGKQDRAAQMAGLLTEARDAASAARHAGQAILGSGALEDPVTRYRALALDGLAANLYRRTATARDARRIARRFLTFET
jgi:transposase